MTETTQDISMSELIYGFMLYASEKMSGVSFPPGTLGTRPWHKFLYDVKKKLAPKFPEIATALDWFDWDAPEPRSPEASEALHLLASIKCDCDFYSGRMKPRIKTDSELSPVLAERMLEIAKTHKDMLIIET